MKVMYWLIFSASFLAGVILATWYYFWYDEEGRNMKGKVENFETRGYKVNVWGDGRREIVIKDDYLEAIEAVARNKKLLALSFGFLALAALQIAMCIGFGLGL